MSASPSPPRQEQLAYPPTSASYPQLIAPFGDASGGRAALRLFFGDQARRFVPAADSNWSRTLTLWQRLLNEEQPPGRLIMESLALSGMDLDPQVTSMARRGAAMELPTLLLLSAMRVTEELLPAETGSQPRFTSRIGSLWGSDPQGPISQLDRFLDHCRIDVSSRRNALFAHSALRESFVAHAQGVRDELDLEWHEPGACARLLPLLFFEEQGVTTNHVFFYEEESDLLEIVLSFSECWRRAHHSRPTSDRSSRELSPGTVLSDRYEIARKIGSGGFAIVYEASDAKMTRQVAIKVIDLERNVEEKSRDGYMRRFEREGRLAVSVRHPCVVEVFDIGVTEQAIPYIVMELLEGWDLEIQMRRGGPMDPGRLLPLFIQALEGLGVAHEKGIVHKDLKPSNIFLKHPGKRHEQLCILDFGVARRVGTHTARLTQTDSAFGTPHYMAPEYSTSQIATPALDVYQMGLVLAELLMGEPVVTHPEPVAAMFQHVRGDLHIALELIESPLGPLLQNTLNTNHLMRYQDGFELADALRAIDPALIPTLKPNAERISLATLKPSSTLSSERTTPMMGLAAQAQTLHPPPAQHNSPPRPRGTLLSHTLLAQENESGISPFASTIPIEDVHRQLDSQRQPIHVELPPNAAKPPKRAVAAAAPQTTGDMSDEPISAYNSPSLYLVLLGLVTVALLITLGYIFLSDSEQDGSQKGAIGSGEVVTAYDRELAGLRDKAKSLPALLETGRIEQLITTIEEMDRSEAKLTPEEVKAIHLIVERARIERPRRTLIDQALELGAERRHEEALAVLMTLPTDSVFWQHPDARTIVDRAKVALLPLAQRMRSEGNYRRARKILEDLLILDPNNTELSYLLMDIIEEAAAQPVLPLELDPQRGMLEPGSGLLPIQLEAVLPTLPPHLDDAAPAPQDRVESSDEENTLALPLDEDDALRATPPRLLEALPSKEPDEEDALLNDVPTEEDAAP